MPDAAPGSLGLLESFAEPDTGLLRTREEAAAWLRATGLLPAEAALSNSEHAALLRLREAIRDPRQLSRRRGGRRRCHRRVGRRRHLAPAQVLPRPGLRPAVL